MAGCRGGGGGGVGVGAGGGGGGGGGSPTGHTTVRFDVRGPRPIGGGVDKFFSRMSNTDCWPRCRLGPTQMFRAISTIKIENSIQITIIQYECSFHHSNRQQFFCFDGLPIAV